MILNPSAGGGRARAVAQRAIARLQASGVQVEVEQTTGPGHATELAAAAAVDRGLTRVAACGGDGTMNEVAAGLAGSATALGLLPSGRGNDLATVLGISLLPEAAADTLLADVRRRIDVGTVNGRRFCGVAAVGFDAEVGARTRAGLWRHAGRAGYGAAVLGTIFRFRAPVFRVEGDFGERVKPLLLCAVSNTGMYGGGVRIAPGSSPDDGLLDCCLVDDASRWRLLRLFRRAYRGEHTGASEVEMLRTAHLILDTDRRIPIVADGEPVGTTPAVFGVEPGALEVIVPRDGAAGAGSTRGNERGEDQ